MRHQVRPHHLLYFTGSVLAALAAAVFTLEQPLMLSPVTKAVILFLVSSVSLLAAVKINEVPVKLATYLLSLAFGTSLIYYLLQLSNSALQSIIVLAAFSALSSGLAYLISNQRLPLAGRGSSTLILGLLLLAVVATGFDLAGPQPEHSLVVKNTTAFEANGEAEIGFLVARNGFALPRQASPPSYFACVYPANAEDFSLPVKFGEKKFLAAGSVTQLDGVIKTEGDVPRQEFKLEQADKCPESGSNTIYIVKKQD